MVVHAGNAWVRTSADKEVYQAPSVIPCRRRIHARTADLSASGAHRQPPRPINRRCANKLCAYGFPRNERMHHMARFAGFAAPGEQFLLAQQTFGEKTSRERPFAALRVT